MNKTKRGLQLAAAITSIVFASILTIGAILTLGLLNDLDVDSSAVAVVYTFIILFSVSIIIISALICRTPNETMHKSLCIADLVLNIILAILYIISPSFWVIMPLAIVGLFIAELCVNGQDDTTQNEEQTSAMQSQPNSNDKIEKLKELNQQGIISNEEMKALIIEELKKNQ